MPALLIALAYVLGTFPSAILVARANGVDISTFGSGNPGASNVTRALGWRKGVWVYVLDAAKAAVATGLAVWIVDRPLGYWCGAAAVLGHMFPAWRRFRGGKGVAAGSGVLTVLHPAVSLASVLVWWGITKVSGKAALGSIVAVGLAPIGLAVKGAPAWEYGAVAALCLLILVKHAPNIARLMRREEHSLSQT